MKHLLVIFALFVLAAFGACQQSGKHDHADHGRTDAAAAADTTTGTSIQQAAVYACPMKCEGEKTYTQAGQCPVCKMDLEAVTAADNKQ